MVWRMRRTKTNIHLPLRDDDDDKSICLRKLLRSLLICLLLLKMFSFCIAEAIMFSCKTKRQWNQHAN